MAESRTKAAEPHGGGGGDKKILGLEPKVFVIVSIVVVVGGYLYLKSKQQQQGQGQGQQQQKQPIYISPTGMTTGQFSHWHRHHSGHRGR